jgi:hypothetical protein
MLWSVCLTGQTALSAEVANLPTLEDDNGFPHLSDRRLNIASPRHRAGMFGRQHVSRLYRFIFISRLPRLEGWHGLAMSIFIESYEHDDFVCTGHEEPSRGIERITAEAAIFNKMLSPPKVSG